MKKSDWYPNKRADQRVMYANVLAKIANYKDAVGLTDDRVKQIQTICQTFLTIYDGIEQNEATMAAWHEWEFDLQGGEPNEPVQPPPVFVSVSLPGGAFKGFVTEFRRRMSQIKESDGYTREIGEDLMIVAPEQEEISPDAVKPEFDWQVLPGYRVRVSGKMQGMHAVKFYYRRKGTTDWVFVGFLTRLPGEIQIAPAQAGQPETGDLRAVFSENNQDVGQYSDNHEITVS